MTGRRDTPTGTIIARLDPITEREAWLTVRRTGIGSSDMGVLLGLSRYRHELDLYLDKRGETDLDDDGASEAALWGNVLEDPVAREWARRHGVTVRKVGTIANLERPHMLCDLDRLVVGCPDHDRCALEVKTRSAFKADDWRDDAIPDDVEAQVMHQLAVTGIDAIHVAALVGGQRLESRVIVPDPEYVADLCAVADEFWRRVKAAEPPEISSLDMLAAHLATFTPEKGVPVELDDETARDVQHLSRIVLEADRALEAAETAKNQLRKIIGEDATDVVIDGETWWTYRTKAKPRRLKVDAVAEALGVDNLDAFKQTAEEAGTTRELRKGKAVTALGTDQ